MYKQDLVLNNQSEFICHKNKTVNQRFQNCISALVAWDNKNKDDEAYFINKVYRILTSV